MSVLVNKIRNKYFILFTLLLMSFESASVNEYQVKATFLFNFAHFADWHPKSFSKNQSPFIIGVLGKDPFGNYLDATVEGENINGHPLTVKHFNNVEQILDCHILFINKNESQQMLRIISSLKGHGILTVSDSDDFIEKGGMIRFINKNNRVQFQINPEATKSENISISSKLLKLAEIVIPQK